MIPRLHTENEYNCWLSSCFVKCNSIVLPLVGSEMQGSGWPDRFIAHREWKGFLEGKRDNGALTDIQLHRCIGFLERGFPVFIIRYMSLLQGLHIETVGGHKLVELTNRSPAVAKLSNSNRDGRFGKLVIDLLRTNTDNGKVFGL